MKCKNCKEVFKPKVFNWKYCDNDICHNIGVKELIKKSRLATEKKNRKHNKEAKLKLKTRSEWLKDLQTVINSIARSIDKGYRCMMCDKNMNMVYGCHYHSVGSNNSLRFNLLNIWAGCYSCNYMKGGNINGYDRQIIDTYNKDLWELIKFDIVRLYPSINLSIEDIKKSLKISRKILRLLKKNNKTYSNEERVIVREKFNKEIGIYLL